VIDPKNTHRQSSSRNTIPNEMSQSSPLGYGDLSQLPQCDQKEIVANLTQRMQNDTTYTAIGPSILVSINPCRATDAYTEVYSNLYSQALEMNYSKPPHIFALASGSFYEMLSTGRDQSIVLL
jgi:myosin heavy subunit